jgi:hypothetical protein
MVKVPPSIIFIPCGILSRRGGSEGLLQNITNTTGAIRRMARAALCILKAPYQFKGMSTSLPAIKKSR